MLCLAKRIKGKQIWCMFSSRPFLECTVCSLFLYHVPRLYCSNHQKSCRTTCKQFRSDCCNRLDTHPQSPSSDLLLSTEQTCFALNRSLKPDLEQITTRLLQQCNNPLWWLIIKLLACSFSVCTQMRPTVWAFVNLYSPANHSLGHCSG